MAVELIDRGWFTNERIREYLGTANAASTPDIEDMVNDAPTADAVEVVRCKDCVHHNEISCLMNEWIQPGDGFCHLGERRTDDAQTD